MYEYIRRLVSTIEIICNIVKLEYKIILFMSRKIQNYIYQLQIFTETTLKHCTFEVMK